MKIVLLLSLVSLSYSLLTPQKSRSFRSSLNLAPIVPPSNDATSVSKDSITSVMNKFEIAPASTLLPLATLLMPLQDVLAKGGEYGILEGRIGSMMHPLTMFALFATSLYR